MLLRCSDDVRIIT